MATPDNPSTTAATEISDYTTASLDKTVPKPEEAHERPGSTSSHDSDEVDLEKQPTNDGTSPAERVQSSTESVYPGKAETAAVMVSLILAIFLVALV